MAGLDCVETWQQNTQLEPSHAPRASLGTKRQCEEPAACRPHVVQGGPTSCGRWAEDSEGQRPGLWPPAVPGCVTWGPELRLQGLSHSPGASWASAEPRSPVSLRLHQLLGALRPLALWLAPAAVLPGPRPHPQAWRWSVQAPPRCCLPQEACVFCGLCLLWLDGSRQIRWAAGWWWHFARRRPAGPAKASGHRTALAAAQGQRAKAGAGVGMSVPRTTLCALGVSMPRVLGHC